MEFKRTFLLVAICIWASGCKTEQGFSLEDPENMIGGPGAGGPGGGGGGGATPGPVTDSFNVTAVRKADLLFVIDNSGSMEGEQATLSDSFAGFIQSFITKNVNANIGVISTDVRPANAGGGTWNYATYSGYPGAGPGRLLSRSSTERFLNTVTTQNLSNRFTQNANLGTGGSGDERALDSAQMALNADMVSATGYNKDFVRDDSLLVVVIVGDEDNGLSPNEFSTENAQVVINATRAAVNALKVGKGGSRFEFVINKALSPPLSLPSYVRTGCGSNCPELTYPAVFRQFAAQLLIPEAGLINIQSNFASDLALMGDSISTQAQKQFVLSKHPSPVSTIRVYIDQMEVTQGAADGWSYLMSNNTVELNGAALQASLGHQLKVEYLGN